MDRVELHKRLRRAFSVTSKAPITSPEVAEVVQAVEEAIDAYVATERERVINCHDMTREARKSRESAEKAVARSETAEAAIQRVRNYAHEQYDDSVPASSEEAWELSTRREVSRELLRLIEEATS